MSTEANPFVSIIILNFNGEEYLTRCLDSVLKNDYSNFEILLVDNASIDSSLKAVQEAFGCVLAAATTSDSLIPRANTSYS